MINVILSGGVGSRLWPVSRKKEPKQFISLFGENSLFSSTITRNKKFCNQTIVVSNLDQSFLAKKEASKVNAFDSTLFLNEPLPRNTAPAIALAAFAAKEDDVLFVTPSDHIIEESESYLNSVREAKELAEKGFLVTFGIKVTRPETGYGYIEHSGNEVITFKEKPSVDVAEKYFSDPRFLWNSGMFCFKTSTFLSELQSYAPDIFEKCFEINKQRKIQGQDYSYDLSLFNNLRSDSIDYAILEKSKLIKVVPSAFSWSDVGCFDEFAKVVPSHEKTLSEESKGNYIYSTDRSRLITTIGLQDTIVIDSKDALLICKKGESQKVKKIFESISKPDLSLKETHITTYRPWGSYTVLEDLPFCKVKRIDVIPGARLSLQKHAMRAEHWTVVKGIATITLNEKVYDLESNQSVYIEKGDVHRLENKTNDIVSIIEVQTGTYFGEDDIIRLQDDYNRA